MTSVCPRPETSQVNARTARVSQADRPARLPAGTANADRASIGIVGIVPLGKVLINEPATLLQVMFIIIIVAGTVDLELVTE